jgi:DNA-binding response OmpR family regulator
MDKILIVEDDRAIATGLKLDLEFEGFQVTTAADGRQGYALATDHDYHLIILDIMLPGPSGLEICQKLRSAGDETPILLLTAARTDEMDKVLGFELGADDYVTKPVGSRELIARVKAILKRTRPEAAAERTYEFDDLRINVDTHEVRKGDAELHLTALEFKLLQFFMAHPGVVKSRDAILDGVWDDSFVTPRAVDTHIANLRKKIEDDPSNPRFIIGVRGFGYKFMARPEPDAKPTES